LRLGEGIGERNVLDAGLQSEVGHRLPEAEMAQVSRQEVRGAGDVADAPMAKLGDVVHRQADAPAVIDGDRGQRAVLEAAVDQDHRGAAGGDVGEQLGVQSRRRGDESVHPAAPASRPSGCARARRRYRC
jgi:hypothetical protein